MEMDVILVSWLIIAAAAFVGEIITPSFFLFWFGIGAIAAIISNFLGITYQYQWGVFVVVSLVGLLLTRPFARSILKEEPKKSGVYGLIGENMRVTRTINNVKGTGQVEWKGEYWQAISEDDSVIEEGNWVNVIRIEGVSLVVKKRR
jgi:membrane protein implicated in regulation of membrane protease activity